MRRMLYIFGSLVLLAGVAIVWIGFAPLDPARFEARPGPDVPGLHEETPGLKAVVPLSELPEGALDQLDAIILATPRTQQVGEGAYVTRSLIWGFPDITRVWVADDNLHIHGALVYGASDLGVNSARIRGWLDALRQG